MLLCCMIAATGCKQAPPAQMETEYEVMTVVPADRMISSAYSATIRGRQDIDIYPQVSGTLTKVCVTEGQRVKNGQTDLLMKALLSLESTDEAYRFFEDLCTIAEIKSMAQRIEVAKMLREHATYQEIARQTGASSATISRVNRALLYGANGYTAVLDAMENAEETEKKD